MNKGKIINFITYTISGIILAWISGFSYFNYQMDNYNNANNTKKVDAIVVLTGGTNRINTGFDMMADGKADYLLITGVDNKVYINDLLHLWGKDIATLPCCIILGKNAKDTIGNALETKKWIDKYNIKNYYLVTSNYHMTRSVFMFNHYIPDSQAIPHIVKPDDFNEVKIDMYLLMLKEYNKLIVSFIKNKITE